MESMNIEPLIAAFGLSDSELKSLAGLFIGVIILFGVVVTFLKCFRKVEQGSALVRSGMRPKKVSFTGMIIIPVCDLAELMDIKVKKIEIARHGKEGLICKDNMRADIEVTFFVRVNDNEADVLRVATSIGCDRASSEKEIQTLFNAKFSEALKTVGKQFEFTQLYQERDTFKEEILKVIGTDLNGFVLDDCAIDYLEQTPLEFLNPDNILDAEGIKKITDLTADQAKLSNNIQRDKERVIKQQDVEAAEAILELERQHKEAKAKQAREVDVVEAREKAESERVRHEQWQIAEQARLSAEEEIHVSEQNKERTVIVAQRNKERTDAVELERVERDRQLEAIDRDRATALKGIERDKVVEIEKRNIQEVIKERVAVEKLVVEEQEKIKDTEADAGADREKRVAIVLAEKLAQEELVKTIKEAEAAQEAARLKADEELYTRVKEAEGGKQSAELKAEEVVIIAEAEQVAAEKESAAKKMLAEAITAESAATGLGEANVVNAKGEAEANVVRVKGSAEAESINAKAEAMKEYDVVGREHEEFKLKLDKAKEIELAEIEVQREIAEEHAAVVGEALKSARIDIVGGETEFFDRITQSITHGKSVDRMVNGSKVLTDVKETFFNSDPEYFRDQIRGWIDQFGVTSEDLKNLSISAVLGQMIGAADGSAKTQIQSLLGAAQRFGIADQPAENVFRKLTSAA